MSEPDRSRAIDALRDFNFEVQAFREAVAAHFAVGVRETQASAHLVAHGQLTATELSRLTGLSPATTTHLLGRLTRAGLATTATDPADLRRTVARPTARARGMVDEVRTWLASTLDRFATVDIELDLVVEVLSVLRTELSDLRGSLSEVGDAPRLTHTAAITEATHTTDAEPLVAPLSSPDSPRLTRDYPPSPVCSEHFM